jgi:hypothetical protein
MKSQEVRKFVFVGSGPTNLEVLNYLLDEELIQEKECSLISSDIFWTGLMNPKDQRNNISTKKNDELEKLQISETFYWGTSCLPVVNFCKLNQNFQKNYMNIVKNWQVQGENDELDSLYPLSNEIIGKLPRKNFAKMIVDEHPTDENSVVGHSRLAISTNEFDGCTNSAKCFDSCPNSAPLNPNKLSKKIQMKYTQLEWIKDSVLRIEKKGKIWQVVTKKQGVIQTENLVLSAGWRSNLSLLAQLPEFRKTATEKNLMGSTVILFPLIFRKRNTTKDFQKSFFFHDLVLATPALEVLTQIYLPTSEISKRILLEISNKTSIKIHKKLHSIFKWTIGRHLGIAMVFLPASPLDETRTLGKQQKTMLLGEIKKTLQPVGGRGLDFFVRYLSPKEGHHIGAYVDLKDIGQKLLFTEQKVTPIYPNLHIVGPMLLPQIHPGPHTISAAAISVTYFQRLLKHEK